MEFWHIDYDEWLELSDEERAEFVEGASRELAKYWDNERIRHATQILENHIQDLERRLEPNQ
jgi:uncharacterized protein (DUF2164 family)